MTKRHKNVIIKIKKFKPMTQAEIKKGYYDSIKRFTENEGVYYGACMKQVFNLKDDVCIEWRVHYF